MESDSDSEAGGEGDVETCSVIEEGTLSRLRIHSLRRRASALAGSSSLRLNTFSCQ